MFERFGVGCRLYRQLRQQGRDARILTRRGLQIEPTAGMVSAQFVQQARNVFSCMFAGTEKQRQHDQMFDTLRNQGLRGCRQIRCAGIQIGADAGQVGAHCLYQLVHGLYGLAPESVSGAMGQQDQTGLIWRRALLVVHGLAPQYQPAKGRER